MRESTTNKTTALIAAGLILAALLFGWSRSRHRQAPSPTVALGTTEALSLGGSVYAQECGFCHGNAVDDRASLSRVADELYRRDGATTLLELLLVGSEPTNDAEPRHPSFEHLSDAQIVALLEYLLAYGPPETTAGGRPPISANDVAARRERR